MSRQEEYVSALKAALGIWGQMRSKELSYDDAILARKLVNMPSGFELHIGVREKNDCGFNKALGLNLKRRTNSENRGLPRRANGKNTKNT